MRFGFETAFGGESQDGYLELASNLYNKAHYLFKPGEEKVLHRPPLYPILLVPAMALSISFQKIYVIILNSLLITGCAWLVFQFSYKYSLLILLSNPWFLYCIKNPMPVFLQTFLYTLFIYLFIKKSSFLKLGITAALLALTHGTGLFVIVIIFSILLIQKKFKKAIGGILISLIIILPWTVRNYKVSGDFIPVVSNAAYLYFKGNQNWGFSHPNLSQSHYWGLKNYTEEKKLLKLALQDIINKPLQFIKKILLNLIYLFFPLIKNFNLIFLSISFYYALLLMLSIKKIIKIQELKIWGFAIIFAITPYLPFLTSIGHNQYAFLTMPFFAIIIGNKSKNE